MPSFNWSERITDIKVTGMWARPCDKCRKVADPLVRITFLDEDKYVCKACATKLVEGRRFGPMFMEELGR